MNMNNKDPEIRALEVDTATNGYYKGLKYTVFYLSFLCILFFGLILLDKLNIARIKTLDKETIEFTKFLVETSYNLIIWIYGLLVGSYIFKGKSGSKFFESIGNLIEKGTDFYKAKAASKAGIKVEEKK